MLDPWFRRAYPWRHLRKAVYWRLIEQRVIRDAAAVIFTCEEERRLGRETFQPWLARQEVILPLGTTAPAQDAGASRDLFLARHPELRQQRLLLFLGRLHDKKGPDLLLEAFRRVAPPLHLVMAGPCADSRYLAQLQRLANGLPVTFTGPLYGEEKWGALAAAEAFILPSHQENLGMAVAEALAVGVPVLISKKVNIWREITEAGAGLAETDDLEGTERLITRWLAADFSAMRRAAQNCFVTQFDIRQTAVKVSALQSLQD
jgi:glycosyltransferase involved in cell wall biosynthesis